MKSYKLIVALFAVTTFAVAQSDTGTTTDYNKWSVEVNVGQNKPEKPYAAGYFSSDPTKYFNFNGIEHIDLGVRYMFNPYFGAKLDFGYDIMQNQAGTTSLPFETNQYRVGLQGVINAGRLLKFESFTNRFGLLLHGGLQVSQLAPQMGVNKGVTEDNGGLMVGVTPQFKISNRLVLSGDFTLVSNVRQHFNWDGSYSVQASNLTGTLFNTSLGLTLYLGKKEKHADWLLNADVLKELAGHDEQAREKIAQIEKMLEDTDRDGVVDYLDAQNNTPTGVVVDTKGRFIDTNKNGTPDELEPRKGADGKDDAVIVSKDDALKTLIEKGYVNVFFDVNIDTPNNGSTNNVYQIINYLRQYPNTKATLTGYADVRGNEESNQDLSNRRAQKVQDIIIASGIDASRISINGQGVDASYPNTKTGLDLARRVSITIQ